MKRILHLCTCLVLLFIQQIKAGEDHHGQLTTGGSLYYRAEPLNNYHLKGESQDDVTLYVHLQGLKKPGDPSVHKIPLNLSIVIDKSGSMSGDKIDNVRKAVQYVISQLDENDRLSIVLYDNYVNVLCEPQRVTDKQFLRDKVQTITADGSTNLEGGMRKGFELVKSVKSLLGGKDEMVNRVILLSDGLANVGISDPVELSKISNNYFNEERISISTFGVGADYNEDLMSKIAGQGGGRYYFISSAEQLPSLFREEIQGISSVVAKNTTLRIDYPQDKLILDKVFLYSYKLSDGALLLNFNDVFAEEQKAIVIRFRLKGKVSEKLAFTCMLTYANALDGEKAIEDKRLVNVESTDDKKVFASGFNKAASEGCVLHISGEKFEQAVQAANNRNFRESKALIKEAKQMLDTHFKLFGEHPFLKELYNDMVNYEKVIDDLEKTKDGDGFRLSIKSHKSSSFNRRYRSKF
jgi:Ca-activated chloride channel family protein